MLFTLKTAEFVIEPRCVRFILPVLRSYDQRQSEKTWPWLWMPLLFCVLLSQVKGNGTITYDIAQMALKALNIDQYGLDEIDNKILTTIIDIPTDVDIHHSLGAWWIVAPSE